MIFKDKFQRLFTIDFRPTRSKYICPACGNERKKKKEPSLFINRNTLIGRCYNCDDVFFEYKESENIVVNHKKCRDINPKLSKSVIEWFKNERGISESSLNYLKVTSEIIKESLFICFNYFKSDKIINIKQRDKEKKFLFQPECEVTFYNYDTIYKNEKVIIVEGELDALAFVEVGLFNVVSLPNGCKNTDFIDRYIFDIERVKEWVLCVDKDAGGMAARSELISKLGIEKCSIINTKDCNDANAYLLKYGKKALQEAYSEAEKLFEDNSINFEFIEQESEITEETKYKPYCILLGQKGEHSIDILTSGNISMVNGKSKSRKTFAIMSLIKLMLSPSETHFSNQKNGIVLFDTEQFKHHSKRFYDRSLDAIGSDNFKKEFINNRNFKMFNLRAYPKETRLQFIKQYIDKNKPSLVFIDNLRDLIRNFNDIEQSDFLLTELSILSETTETHICCTLHVNKADNNARGHLGSEFTQKCETAFLIETDDQTGITTINPDYTRNEKFEPIQFRLNNGIPEMIDTKEQIEIKHLINMGLKEEAPF